MSARFSMDSANTIAGSVYPQLLRRFRNLPDSGNAVARRTLRLNPLSKNVWLQQNTSIAALRSVGPDSARAICGQLARIDAPMAANCDASRMAAFGDLPGAAAAFRRAMPSNPSANDRLGLVYRLLSIHDTAGARAELTMAVARRPAEYVREGYVAARYLSLGERELAIQWWLKAAASNSADLMFLAADSSAAPLRTDPRILAILKRVKLK